MDIKESRQLRQDISPAGAWAFAIGTSIGWGSLVVTSNTYLSQAGIMGSVIGLLLGAAAMLLISRNYFYPSLVSSMSSNSARRFLYIARKASRTAKQAT